MKFDFHKELVRIWGYAVELYRDGHQDACQFPIEEDVPFLESIGMNRMDVFDFAEDWVRMGEPDLAVFLLIHEQRKDYFWETQKKAPSTQVLDPTSLPAKNESLHGIVWLPRIIPKARAKLRGELDPTPCIVVEVTGISFGPTKSTRLNFFESSKERVMTTNRLPNGS